MGRILQGNDHIRRQFLHHCGYLLLGSGIKHKVTHDQFSASLADGFIHGCQYHPVPVLPGGGLTPVAGTAVGLDGNTALPCGR